MICNGSLCNHPRVEIHDSHFGRKVTNFSVTFQSHCYLAWGHQVANGVWTTCGKGKKQRPDPSNLGESTMRKDLKVCMDLNAVICKAWSHLILRSTKFYHNWDVLTGDTGGPSRKANHQEVYIFRGLLPELRCVCCDGPVPVVFLVSSKLGDDWNYWPIWIPRLSSYFGIQNPAKKKRKVDVWEDFLIQKRRICALVQTPVYFKSVIDSFPSQVTPNRVRPSMCSSLPGRTYATWSGGPCTRTMTRMIRWPSLWTFMTAMNLSSLKWFSGNKSSLPKKCH